MRYFRTGLALLLLLPLFLTPAFGQTPEDGWQVSQDRLDNGLTVLVLEDHRAPVVTLQVWYKVGSRKRAAGHHRHLAPARTPHVSRHPQNTAEGEFTRLVNNPRRQPQRLYQRRSHRLL